MKLSKLSKRDFFKLIGGGATASVIAANTASGSTDAAMKKMEEELHALTPLPVNPSTLNLDCMMDVQSHILWARFKSSDFQSGRVHPFAQHRYPDPMATNIDMANCLPAPTSMVIGGIMVLLNRDTSDEAMAEFEQNVCGVLQLGLKHFQELPMSRIASRSGLDNLVDRSSGKPTDFVTAKMYRCDPPLYIAPMMMVDFILQSRVEWKAPSFTGHVLFDGLIARPVQ